MKALHKAQEARKDRPASSMFKKGTSEFLNRKIRERDSANEFSKADFQKSLEKQFKTDVLGDSGDRTFLPIEAFDPLLGIEVPTEVIKKYRDLATGETIGLSKWNFPNGDAELRRCVIENFLDTKDLYEVRWCHNRSIKKSVSRFNLIFELEDKEEYERRIFMAHQYRKDAETLMRYHYMIDNVKLPKTRAGKGGQSVSVAHPELLDQVKTRISYLIRTYNPYKQFV